MPRVLRGVARLPLRATSCRASSACWLSSSVSATMASSTSSVARSMAWAVAQQRLAVGAAGLRHFGVDAAEVEQAPVQPGQRRGLERRAGDQLAGVERLEAERAGQRERG